MDEALYQPFLMPTAARAHIWRHAPATRRPRHFHAEPELNLVTGVSVTFAMGEKRFSLTAVSLEGAVHTPSRVTPDRTRTKGEEVPAGCTLPLNVLLTIWASNSAAWAGALDSASAPTSAEVDWIKVYGWKG